MLTETTRKDPLNLVESVGRKSVGGGVIKISQINPTRCIQMVTSRTPTPADHRAILRESGASHPLVRRVLVFKSVGNRQIANSILRERN
jgi:hypothetical protein